MALLYGNSCKVTKSDGALFDAISVDLAEYSTVFASPQSAVFTGRKADQSTVTVTFTTDGVIDGTGSAIDFQTFEFPDSFRGLVSLEVDSLLAYDNFVLRATPAPVRRFGGEVTLSLALRSETAPLTSSSTVISKPSEARLGNRELIAFFASEGLIPSAAGWRLVAWYDGHLVEQTPGPIHFELVNAAGTRVNVDSYLSIESVAEVQRLDLSKGTAEKAPVGKLVEERFCKLLIKGYLEDPIVVYGPLMLRFEVDSEGLAQFAKAKPARAEITGHSGTFTVASGRLKLGLFSEVK